MTTDLNFMLLARKKSARLSSVVVPVWMQTEAPLSSFALFTLSDLRTMKPCPS